MADPDLNLLVALDALLAETSVAGASRRLGLSASAMSRTLGRLRVVTGDPLLVLAGRHMVLTPHAEELRERTRNALGDARAALRPAMAELDLATLQRTFTIRANDGFVEAFAALLIADAAGRAPQVHLRFVPKPGKTPTHLREGLADLEIGVASGMGPEVRLQALFCDRFIGVVRQGHPLEADGKVTPERYVSFGHVVASRHGHAEGPVDAALAASGLERRIVAVVPGFPAALAVARASDLVALVPASLLGDPVLRPGRASDVAMHAFELPVKTAGITVSQMWHPRLDADPAHRWLRQRVLANCRRKMAL